VSEYGFAIQKWFEIGEGRGFLRGSYKRPNIEGTIEFWPKREEKTDTFEINGAYVSPTVSDDRFAIAGTYVNQNIEQTIPKPLRFDRDRKISAGFFAWGNIKLGRNFGNQSGFSLADSTNDSAIEGTDPRPVIAIENLFSRRFDPRNLKLFGGFVHDVETFGNTDVMRKDYFIGTSLPWETKNKPLHVAIQGTIFMYDVDNDKTQENSQYRTDITAYYQPSEDWVLVVPFRHDLALDGPTDFKNWRLGIGVRRSWSIGEGKHRRVALSAGYAVQNFYNIDKVLNIFQLGLSVDL